MPLIPVAIVGGKESHIKGNLSKRLNGIGLFVSHHIVHQHTVGDIPPNIKGVLCVTDFIGHGLSLSAKEAARKKGLPFAYISRKWSHSLQSVNRFLSALNITDIVEPTEEPKMTPEHNLPDTEINECFTACLEMNPIIISSPEDSFNALSLIGWSFSMKEVEGVINELKSRWEANRGKKGRASKTDKDRIYQRKLRKIAVLNLITQSLKTEPDIFERLISFQEVKDFVEKHFLMSIQHQEYKDLYREARQDMLDENPDDMIDSAEAYRVFQNHCAITTKAVCVRRRTFTTYFSRPFFAEHIRIEKVETNLVTKHKYLIHKGDLITWMKNNVPNPVEGSETEEASSEEISDPTPPLTTTPDEEILPVVDVPQNTETDVSNNNSQVTALLYQILNAVTALDLRVTEMETKINKSVIDSSTDLDEALTSKLEVFEAKVVSIEAELTATKDAVKAVHSGITHITSTTVPTALRDNHAYLTAEFDAIKNQTESIKSDLQSSISNIPQNGAVVGNRTSTGLTLTDLLQTGVKVELTQGS